jgi:hypothetical protein
MATKTKETYAEKLRSAMRKKAEDASASKGGNPLEFNPDFGTTRIRILPPIGDDFETDPMSIGEDKLFYHSHKFHFIPDSVEDIGTSKGKFMWVGRTLTDKFGKERKNPLAEAVAQFYSVGRKENDESLLKLGGALKLKRNYCLNILKYNEDGTAEFRILTDKTNEGKLIKVICAAMGLPFFRDVDDNWVDKNSMEYDEDQEFYDLLDIENGYDFKIVKEKTGVNPWDISFEKSFVMKKSSRALTDEERELMGKRVDLKTTVQYETSYEAVKAILDNLMGEDSVDDEAEVDEVQDVKPAPKKVPVKSAKPTITKTPVDNMDEESMDNMLSELDDE